MKRKKGDKWKQANLITSVAREPGEGKCKRVKRIKA